MLKNLVVVGLGLFIFGLIALDEAWSNWEWRQQLKRNK
jgi:hypothetical protein